MFSFLKKEQPTSKKSGLSLKPRKYFFRDLIIVVGIVLVWRSIWHFADRILFPEAPFVGEVVGILLGLFLLYLPDGDLSHLSGDVHHEHHHYYNHKKK
ncbi:hypothetical protein KA517_00820 [Candidatus Gracilibacteria bacterium]|nr:hypothetical protein [Candidatus Gracilibacteria bacterium]